MNKILIILFLTCPLFGDRIAHYKMNDNAATSIVIDSVGGYQGTYKDGNGNLNTSTGSTTGKISNCLSFDGWVIDGGTGEYIDTGNPFESVFQDSFSISLWVKQADLPTPHSGYAIGTATDGEADCVWIILLANGTISFQYTSNGNQARFYYYTDPFPEGVQDWHHIVMVHNANTRGVGGVSGYLDGNLLAFGESFKGDTTDVVSADYQSERNLFIGAENYGIPLNHYEGLIDDVRIYSNCLGEDDINFLYNGGDGTEDDFPYYVLIRE